MSSDNFVCESIGAYCEQRANHIVYRLVDLFIYWLLHLLTCMLTAVDGACVDVKMTTAKKCSVMKSLKPK